MAEQVLPFIDRHCVDVNASRERTWAALAELFAETSDRTTIGLLSFILGPRFRRVEGPPLEVGSTVVGFQVTQSDPEGRVVLSGEHRFSRYKLTLELRDGQLCAVTHAVFPGPHGALYKAILLGAGTHAVATKRLLRTIKIRAEKSVDPHQGFA